jgi:hypothetical protein
MSLESRRASDVNVGDELPQLAIPLTTSLVVSGALASRDFTPVHHDRAWSAATSPTGPGRTQRSAT